MQRAHGWRLLTAAFAGAAGGGEKPSRIDGGTAGGRRRTELTLDD